MTELGSTHTARDTSRMGYGTESEPTGWSGFIVFASSMMILVGMFQVVQGLVALFDDGFYLVSARGLVLDVNYNVWGTVHLLLGVLLLASGAGVLVGNMAARIAGIVVAGLSAVVNMVFIGAYPLWSILIISVDVLVIFALTAHGREMKDR